MNPILSPGDLDCSTTEQELRQTFAQHGSVTSSTVAVHRMTGPARGFNIVECGPTEEVQHAVCRWVGAECNSGQLDVKPALLRGDRNRGGSRAGSSHGDHRRGGRANRGGRCSSRLAPAKEKP